MPPKKRIRRSTRATHDEPSAASTPASNAPDSDSAMPDIDQDNPVMPSSSSTNKHPKPRKEPINDEWTDEQDTSLFQGLIRWKPVGMHKHFRMISLCNFLRNHGYDPDVDTHTRPDGIRKHLEKYYDLETLGQREDHIDEDPQNPQFVEFSLPLDEYEELMWEQGRIKKGNVASTPGTALQEDEASDVPLPPPTSLVPQKRKRANTTTKTRMTRSSTVDETDRSSIIPSRAPSEVPTAATSRAARGDRRSTRVSNSRQASKDNTADEEGFDGGDADKEAEHGDEADNAAAVKANTRKNAKVGKGRAQVKGQSQEDDADKGNERADETDDAVSVKANTRSNNAKAGKGSAKAKGQSQGGKADKGDEHADETDDAASVKANTRSNAKLGKGGAQAKGQSQGGDTDKGDERADETDDAASVKANTRSNAKAGKASAQAKGQATAARKSARKR